tara:strand:- start:10902 stop:11132 length:231 start_codon:yes stop_codon:yes gene_type:complete
MWDKILEWGWRREANKQNEATQKKIDMMADDVDPESITIENAYKTRWIWYHTILAIGIFFTNILLVAIFLLLAIKL